MNCYIIVLISCNKFDPVPIRVYETFTEAQTFLNLSGGVWESNRYEEMYGEHDVNLKWIVENEGHIFYTAPNELFLEHGCWSDCCFCISRAAICHVPNGKLTNVISDVRENYII